MAAKIMIRDSINGSYYFVLKSKNGATLMQSNYFLGKNYCIKSIKSVQKLLAEEVTVVDATK